jgi:ABC-type dipeptide/oligopeptide/nickel transport system permease subunit
MKRNERKYKREGLFLQTIKRLLKNRFALVGMGMVIGLVVLCAAAPFIAPYTYAEMDLSLMNSSPSLKHLFGTDALGRDLLSRLLYGGCYSLFLGFFSSTSSCIVAIIFGCIAGYFGNIADNIILRICDIVQAIPGILLSIVISAVLGPGYFNTILAVVVGGIPSTVRLVRAQVISIRSEEYLEAALTVDCGPIRIMFRHILPNILSPIIVGFTMGIGRTIMVAASLSFIGLGVPPPTPEWGALISEGRDYFRNYPWQILFPGLAIFITVLGINIFGDGLRDALDPKLKK